MRRLRDALVAGYGEGRRVDGYYLPVAEWALAQRDAGARVLGINGPQGGGKSTLADALVGAFAAVGVRAVTVSIDDMYLPRTGQLTLAAAHAGNPCLEHRGYPGTHDVALGEAVLDALREGRSVDLPAYDKSAFGGRGDRAPRERWRRVEGRADLVIFEGWMLGFVPLPEDDPRVAGPLAAPNRLLPAYAGWNARLDATVLLHAAAPSDVVRWRVDSERARRDRGEAALSEAETRDYIERFLPAYEAWLPGLLARPPGRAALRVPLGPDRLPVPPWP